MRVGQEGEVTTQVSHTRTILVPVRVTSALHSCRTVTLVKVSGRLF